VEPTIIAPPDTVLPKPNVNMPVWGDPLAKTGPPSNRPRLGGGIESASGGGVASGAGGGVLRVGGGVSAPIPLYKPDPDYSEEARKAHYSGTVMVSIIVDSAGPPRDIKVIRGVGLGPDEKAIEAVAKWKFRPGYRNGQPVAVQASIEVNFRLLFPEYPRWKLVRVAFQVPVGASRPGLDVFTQPKAREYKGGNTISTVLHFVVDEDGVPRNPTVDGSLQSDMTDDLFAAVKNWRFTPAQKDGAPDSANATFEFAWEKN
jgi:TonB family protein